MQTQIPSEWSGRINPCIFRRIEAERSFQKLAWRIYSRGGSPYTANNYVVEVTYFCRWLGLTPAQALATERDWPALMNDYLDYALVERKLSPSTTPRAVSAMKKWLSVNDVFQSHDPAWYRVERNRVGRVEMEELPDKAALRAILASGSAADRAMALVALSSGLRLRTVLQLQVKHFDLSREVPLVSPPPETTKFGKRFHTFISPEAKEALLLSLRDRERRGIAIREWVSSGKMRPPPGYEERLKVGSESYVVVAEKPLGRPIRRAKSGDRRWIKMVKRAGMARKTRSWHTLHFHVLRKYFKTWTTMSGINPDIVDYFLGHRTSLRQVYFIPEGVQRPPEEVVRRLEDEYRKALPALTVGTWDADWRRRAPGAMGNSWEERIARTERTLAEIGRAMPN